MLLPLITPASHTALVSVWRGLTEKRKGLQLHPTTTPNLPLHENQIPSGYYGLCT